MTTNRRTHWTICHLCGRESGDTNGKYDGTRWCGCPYNEEHEENESETA